MMSTIPVPGMLVFLILVTVSLKYVAGDDYDAIDQESGEGGVIEFSFNRSRLEQLILKAVDQKISELKSKFLKQANFNLNEDKVSRSEQQSTKVKPDRLQSLEDNFKDLTEELEKTKEALNSHTLSLDRYATALEVRQTATRRLQGRQGKLEKTVFMLANRVDKLRRIVKPATPRKTHNSAKTKTPTKQPKPHNLYPRDCAMVQKQIGQLFVKDFQVEIKPNGMENHFTASCRVQNNTGWTVIQRRFNGSVDFYKNWQEYKDGFGSTDGEFWIGNDRIHHLTKNGQMSLRVLLEDWEGDHFYAEYKQFKIDNEEELYRLHVSGYHGNAGDSLTSTWESHDGFPFSTHDRDNDGRFYDNCSKHFHGAWWFNRCFASHLNGKYLLKDNHNKFFQRVGVYWNSLKSYASLKSTTMMIAPRGLL